MKTRFEKHQPVIPEKELFLNLLSFLWFSSLFFEKTLFFLQFFFSSQIFFFLQNFIIFKTFFFSTKLFNISNFVSSNIFMQIFRATFCATFSCNFSCYFSHLIFSESVHLFFSFSNFKFHDNRFSYKKYRTIRMFPYSYSRKHVSFLKKI